MSQETLDDPQTQQRPATLPWIVAGLLGLSLAGLTAWVGWNNYDLGTLDRPGPGFFPLLVAGFLALTSVIALLESRWARFSDETIPWRRFAIAAGIILGGALALPYIGFLAVAFLGGTVLAVLIEGSFRWRIPIAMAVMTLAVWLVFEYVLEINLP